MLGLIENMSGALCPECNTTVPLYEGGCADLCEALDVPLLGKIPFDRQLANACDQGDPLDPAHPIAKHFDEIALYLHDFLESKKNLN